MEKARKGYKMTEIGEIPEDWEVAKIKDVADTTSGGTPSRIHKEYYENGSIPWIKTGELNNKYIFSAEEKITEEAILKSSANLIPINSVIIAMYGATIGKTSISKIEITTNQACCAIICKEAYLNNEFLYYTLSFNRDNIIELGAGGAQPNISQMIIREYKILVPPLEEQREIASILSSIDDQIEITDNLIKKTKELKKGLMQRLLTRGIGHDKFKDTVIGRIPEEWEVKKLIDISMNKGEYGIGASATEYIPGNPRYLRITDIGDESRLLFDDIKGLNDDEYQKYILKENDIVFARTGNTTGKNYVYNSKDGELVYAGFLIKFSINPNIANVNFVKYVVQSKRYWDWVNVMSTRSG